MITFDTATTKWLAELRAAGASQGSIDLRAYHLNRWAAAHGDPLTATRDDLIQFLAAITGAPEYRRSWRSSLRSFYRTACELAIIDADPAALLPKVRVPIAEARPAPDAAIRTALARADQRQRLMLMLGAVSGLRRAEIARVHTRDLEDGDLLRVHGKGGRVRVVPLDRPLAEAIRRAPAGWLFPGLPGRTSTGHLTPPHVGVLLRRILPEGVTPHMLRHAAATALHDGGLDVFELRGFLGHASVATTQRYVYVRPTRTIAAAREAARRFDAA